MSGGGAQGGGTLELPALLPLTPLCPVTYNGSLSLWPCAISAFLGEPHLADAKRDTFHQRGRRGWLSVLFMEERGVFPENSDMPRRFQNTVSSGSPELFSQLYVLTLPPSARPPVPPLGKASTGQAVCSLGTPASSCSPKRFIVFQATGQSLPSRGTLKSGGQQRATVQRDSRSAAFS